MRQSITELAVATPGQGLPEIPRDVVVRGLGRIGPKKCGLEPDAEADAMPAHLKSILTGVSLSIPVADGRPALGTLQSIYDCEYRRAPQRRRVMLHLIGSYCTIYHAAP